MTSAVRDRSVIVPYRAFVLNPVSILSSGSMVLHSAIVIGQGAPHLATSTGQTVDGRVFALVGCHAYWRCHALGSGLYLDGKCLALALGLAIGRRASIGDSFMLPDLNKGHLASSLLESP
mgnify:CR=1 FL=1